jgi:hypothetical protein
MKFIRTVVVFDRGKLVERPEWVEIHDAIEDAIKAIVNPIGNDRFVLRRKKPKYDKHGKKTNQWHRNGVVPIRNQFLTRLRESGWESERPTGLGPNSSLIRKAEKKTQIQLMDFPSKRIFTQDDEDWAEIFKEKVGDFDFYSELEGGTRCAVEWETGNISSSHRSMNKLCLVMMAELIDIGVLILPSRELYPHLTDRVGNWMELSPYLPLWQRLGTQIKRGLLAVTVVEQDELTDDEKVGYIPQGRDGRSAEGAARLG